MEKLAELKRLLEELTNHLRGVKYWQEADFVDVGQDEEIANLAKRLGIPVEFSAGYIGDDYTPDQEDYWKIVVPEDL